jgi:hypothetical protein
MNSWFYYELMVLLNVSISANIVQILLQQASARNCGRTFSAGDWAVGEANTLPKEGAELGQSQRSLHISSMG